MAALGRRRLHAGFHWFRRTGQDIHLPCEALAVLTGNRMVIENDAGCVRKSADDGPAQRGDKKCRTDDELYESFECVSSFADHASRSLPRAVKPEPVLCEIPGDAWATKVDGRQARSYAVAFRLIVALRTTPPRSSQ